MLFSCAFNDKFGGCVDQTSDEDSILNIFQQIAFASKPSKELVTRELLIFRHYQVDPKDIKCLLQWCEKHSWFFGLSNLKHYKVTN